MVQRETKILGFTNGGFSVWGFPLNEARHENHPRSSEAMSEPELSRGAAGWAIHGVTIMAPVYV
jgi:hypothetical protein